MEQSQPRRKPGTERRRGVARVFGYLLVLVGLLLAALYLVCSTRLVWGTAARVGLEQLAKQLKVPCEIGARSGDPLREIRLRRLVVGRGEPSPTGSLIEVQDATVHLKLLAALRRVPPGCGDGAVSGGQRAKGVPAPKCRRDPEPGEADPGEEGAAEATPGVPRGGPG